MAPVPGGCLENSDLLVNVHIHLYVQSIKIYYRALAM